MTFDWFRRQYDQNAESVPAAETDPAAQESAVENEAAPAVAEDYLSWAKVAYQNIQKRQQTEAIATPSEVPAATETVKDAIADVESASSDIAVPAATDVAAAEPATPLPFWAQSEADRQERLERLKENAIVEPEPAIAPTTTAPDPTAPATTAVDDAELVLDEGFLWSSEILAAQGRRPDQISLEEITWLNRLRQGLDKTRRGLINQLRSIVGQGPLNDDAVDEIESVLLQADVGVAATDAIISALQSKLRQETLPPDAALTYLKQILRDMLDAPLKNAKTRFFAPEDETLNIWLITGVNGAGKTTTIGKLAHIAQKSGYNCLIAAADTFRAAAVEQVKVWGSRSGVEVIANPGQNTDPAAVVFDAIAAAQSRGTDLLLVDTAGRLQNKKNLMDELSKIRRIIDKKADNAVVESLLVLDATLGQNGLRQAEVFSEAAQLSGVILTKLDGTAKGGIALAIVQQLGLPIRFIGAGEGIEDLRPFSSYEFVEALLNG
ncbi:MAG: signal recognition particle-docking protein FtsY [Tildeniella nuda ZEHNDER 1965/U140]|jgi:fused signal recognition particle receptor|nr:signal recognition particle-docking protein FtsY [Tildeniella nuda ZEHNDER 1965/U140]